MVRKEIYIMNTHTFARLLHSGCDMRCAICNGSLAPGDVVRASKLRRFHLECFEKSIIDVDDSDLPEIEVVCSQ